MITARVAAPTSELQERVYPRSTPRRPPHRPRRHLDYESDARNLSLIRTNNTLRRSTIDGKPRKDDTGSTVVFAAKLRKKWQFASDAIGLVDGPRDLARRKGLSG